MARVASCCDAHRSSSVRRSCPCGASWDPLFQQLPAKLQKLWELESRVQRALESGTNHVARTDELAAAVAELKELKSWLYASALRPIRIRRHGEVV